MSGLDCTTHGARNYDEFEVLDECGSTMEEPRSGQLIVSTFNNPAASDPDVEP